MAPPAARSASIYVPPTGVTTACTSAWDGTGTLTVSVTSGGAVLVKHGGQFLQYLNTALTGWSSGNPS